MYLTLHERTLAQENFYGALKITMAANFIE